MASSPVLLETLLDGSTPLAHTIGFLAFGFQEILVIGFVALLVFGGNLPDVMRQLGRSYGKLRQSLNELTEPVRDELRQVRDVRGPGRSTTSYAAPSEGASSQGGSSQGGSSEGIASDSDLLPTDGADVPPLEEDEFDLPDQVPPITTSKPDVRDELEEPPPV